MESQIVPLKACRRDRATWLTLSFLTPLKAATQLIVLLSFLAVCAQAQSCMSGDEIDAPTKAALNAAARQYLDMSAHGDVAGLRANAIPAVAGSFGGIEQAVVANKQYLAQAPPQLTGEYVLDASQSKGALPRAVFYCGIYNSPDRVDFSISNLPAGKYAVVIQTVSGKAPITLTMILQDLGGNSWKLAGYYLHLTSIGGHDGQWFLTQARQYKTKGQLHNAWLYYLTAWDLMAPVNFMSTPQLDKIAQEMQTARPPDMPSDSAPLELAAGGKTYKVTDLAATPVENDLDLRVRYTNPDAGNAGAASQDNMALIKALVTKYPEFRDAFAGVIARAVDSSGHDYGTVLAMKDIK